MRLIESEARKVQVQKVHSEREQKTMKFSNNNKLRSNYLLTLLLLIVSMMVTAPSVYAGTPTGSTDPNNHSVEQIMASYCLRHKACDQYVTADKVKNQESQGPGQIESGGPEKWPTQVWPKYIPSVQSDVPTLRDTAINKNMFKTFGYPLSDTQYQIIERHNQNRFMEQLYNPEKAHWMAQATGGLAANSAANSAGAFAINQACSAIDFCKQFLTNFTAEPDNVWQKIRDQLFVPMAILLLLPGAVLAQVKAIVAQGSPVLVGDVHPFEGLLRSIVAVFLIPGTFLVINYGIDVANSLTFTIADEYKQLFGSDMYEDAKCAIKRAFPMNKPEWNRNAISTKETPKFQGTTCWAALEGYTLCTARIDPCAGVEESRVPDEDVVQSKNINRLMMNTLDGTSTMSWNLSCAFQMAFLYYLWCMGPIAAALWVWPVGAMRGALASWIEGVITVCFWSLFWNTVILLMACFRGVGDSGTIIMTALIFLAVQSVKSAFDFASLASAAVTDAATKAQGVANSAKGGGAGGGGSSAGAGGQGNKSGGHAGVGAHSPGHSGGSSSGGAGHEAAKPHSPSVGGATPKSDAIGTGKSDNATTSPGGKSGVGADGLGGALPTGQGGDKKADAAGHDAKHDAGLPPSDAKGHPKGHGGKHSGDGPPSDAAGAAAAALGGAAGHLSSSTSGSLDVNAKHTDAGGGGGGGGIGGIAGGTGTGHTGPGGIPLTGGSDAAKLAAEGHSPLGAFGVGPDKGTGNPFNIGNDPTAKGKFDNLLGDHNAKLPAVDAMGNALGFQNAVGGADAKGHIPGTDVFGKTDPTHPGSTLPGGDPTSHALYKTGADGQPVMGADGKPMLDSAQVGHVPPLTGNLANDPGALSAQKTAVDTMAMSGVTGDQLSRAMANPNGADYQSIANATHVAPPLLDAALHGNTSAGVMTAVGFGSTDTAAAFASPSGMHNETAQMATSAYHQAQSLAGNDPGMIQRATMGMDAQAGAHLLNSPAMDAQFASTVSSYQQAHSGSPISGDLSPAGSVAAANGFNAPYSVPNDPGAVSAHNAAADIMSMTHTSSGDLQRALANPSGAEYHQLSERMGASPALVDAALHGSASAGAIVETGFGHTAAAQANADTSFTAHQSVSMYQSAASHYGADTVQQAAVGMNASAGAQILQSNQMDQQFASTVQSYQHSMQANNNYSSADTGYVGSVGSTPAITTSMVSGDASPAGSVASSMGYSAPYSVSSHDPGAISAAAGASDIMAMTHTSPVEMQRALSNPSGSEYQQLTERFGSSPALVDAALHGSTSAGAIVETGFGHTSTAHNYQDSSYTAQQSVAMYNSASSTYGAETVHNAAVNMNVDAGSQILHSNQLDQQFASTVQSYQQSYQSSHDFNHAGTSYVSDNGGSPTPAITSSLISGEAAPAGSYAAATGYSAPYTVSSSDPGAVAAQNTASDIMAMTHTSQADLRQALAQPDSPQYTALAERMGASPALIDSALHGNVSSAVVASAGFGATETAHQYADSSATAAQSIQYNASAHAAAGSSYNGGDVVYQAAVNMDPAAGQAILGGTGLDNQYTATVNAYRAEASSGGGYSQAPDVANHFTSSGGSAAMSSDMISSNNQAQYNYTSTDTTSGYAPNYVASAPDYNSTTNHHAAAPDYNSTTHVNTNPDYNSTTNHVSTNPDYNSTTNHISSTPNYTSSTTPDYSATPNYTSTTPDYSATPNYTSTTPDNSATPNYTAQDPNSNYVAPTQNYVADQSATPVQNTGPDPYTVASNYDYGNVAGNTWTAPEVVPDNTVTPNNEMRLDNYDQQQQHQHDLQQQHQQEQRVEPRVADGGGERKSALGAVLGGAAIARATSQPNRPTGGAPVPKTEAQQKEAQHKEAPPPPVQKGAPPVESKGINLSGPKGRGKTQKELDAELAAELERQRRSMPGFDGK